MQKKQLIPTRGFLLFHILTHLRKKQYCGDELALQIGKKKGLAKLTPGTIYPALKTLRRKKLVTYTRKGRKKCYSLTRLGKKELNSTQKQLLGFLRHAIKKF